MQCLVQLQQVLWPLGSLQGGGPKQQKLGDMWKAVAAATGVLPSPAEEAGGEQQVEGSPATAAGPAAVAAATGVLPSPAEEAGGEQQVEGSLATAAGPAAEAGGQEFVEPEWLQNVPGCGAPLSAACQSSPTCLKHLFRAQIMQRHAGLQTPETSKPLVWSPEALDAWWASPAGGEHASSPVAALLERSDSKASVVSMESAASSAASISGRKGFEKRMETLRKNKEMGIKKKNRKPFTHTSLVYLL